RDVAIETEDGPTFVSPGMKGEVISLHDGFHLDVIQGDPVPPKALIQFESGMRLLVDQRMKWEKVRWSQKAGRLVIAIFAPTRP
ncbi:hypothetical protein MYX65_12205, partial [Acidobacteria bacterium AH-259-L09]|nr:hypothetical protein [Acidobacteria bacterium AH-259-L09]